MREGNRHFEFEKGQKKKGRESDELAKELQLVSTFNYE